MHPNRFYRIVMRTSGADDRGRAERVTAAVLRTLRKRQLTFGEAEDVIAELPRALQEVWAEAQSAGRVA